MELKVDLPYPEVKVMKKDYKLAGKIFNSYAGVVSEDTTIHNYILEMLMIEDKEVQKILKGIAINEMKHLEILGSMLKKLGFIPMFYAPTKNNMRWFSGEYITKNKCLKDFLIENINNEKQSIYNYEQIIEATDDIYVKEILKRIILDERLHIEVFKKLYHDLVN